MERAERLSMTEAELRASMSGAELHRWMMLDKVRAAEEEKRVRDMKRQRK